MIEGNDDTAAENLVDVPLEDQVLESLADHQSSGEETVTINSMNFVKKWSAEEIANDQREDTNMAVLYKAKVRKLPNQSLIRPVVSVKQQKGTY